MKIKNISKKVIGNERFQLLPGDDMLVAGNEAWVTDYLERKKLEVIDAATTPSPAAGEHKAEKEIKKSWAAILKNGNTEEILKLAAELEIPTDNVSQEDLIGMIKVAIK